MSLMGNLAKIAIGVAIAKGVSGLMKGQTASGQQIGGENGEEGQADQQGSGIQDMLGSVLGGGAAGGGLGGMLDQFGLGGGTQTNEDGEEVESSSGGIGDMLGNLTGGGSSGGGGLTDLLGGLTGSGGALGGMLGGLVGGAAATRAGGGSFGDLFNNALQNQGEPDIQPTQEEEAAAGIMLRAMIQAAKADGVIDDEEREKLMKMLEDATEEELEFVQAEFDAPIDITGLADQTPEGLKDQVYVMSLMGIKLDSEAEATYLKDLALGLELDEETVNAIHDKLNVPRIYA